MNIKQRFASIIKGVLALWYFGNEIFTLNSGRAWLDEFYYWLVCWTIALVLVCLLIL